jgi:tripartite-type tricarboxylate transporter receptor subunit TctC
MRTILAATLGAALLAAQPAAAQTYPTRPVTMVVPYAPGGSSDIMARAVGQRLSELWGQPVVIENRPGGTTTVGAAHAARQPADGYTLLLAAPPFIISQHVYRNLPYEAQRDFAAVSLVAFYPLVLTAHPQVPAGNIKELIAYAKANPGRSYPSPGAGTTAHLVHELLAREEKLDIVHVPYRSGGQGIIDLVSGRLQFYSGPTIEVMPHIKAGRLKAVAVLSPFRSSQLPDVPTSKEQGYPYFAGSSWSTIAVPAGTPKEIVEKISRDVATVVRSAAFREKLEAQGAEIVGSSPEEAAAFWAAEDKVWGPLVKSVGVTPDH